MTSPVAVVARWLRCSEGQAYTLLIGLVVAIALAVAGIPPVLRAHPVRQAAAVSPLLPQPTAPVGAPVTIPASPPLASTPAVDGSSPSPAAPPAPVDVSPPAPSPVVATPPPPLPAPTAGQVSLFARIGAPGPPGGLAVAPDGTVYATTDNGSARGQQGPSHVLSFDPSGTVIGDRAVTGQASDHADGLAGAAVDPLTGEVAVLDPDTARVIGLDPSSGAQRLIAQLPDLPACLVSLAARPCEAGAQDRKPFPASAVYDTRGNLYVSDPTQDTIWRVARGVRTASVWFQSTDFATGDGPDGLTVNRGAIEFTAGTTLDPSNFDGGGLYRVVSNPDGSAGTLSLVASFASGDEPGALAAGRTGTRYVVIRKTGSIVAVSPSGATSTLLAAPGNGPVPLDGPLSLAVTGGALLVADGGSSHDPARWAILAIGIADGPPS